MELAQVGNVLLLSGSDDALKPFIETKSTFIVDSVDEWRSYLLKNGAVVVRDKKKVPTGYNMTVKHPDGTIVEYVQYTK
ncbi:VOC family protein [Clostridioides difficile]